MLRRNIVVAGINLTSLKQKQFRIGDVLLEGTIACAPCARMEENLGAGGFNAMRGHGGLCARVIEHGTIRTGDAVTYVGDDVTPVDEHAK
jgi:MOSC domain-containing protein YiiM